MKLTRRHKTWLAGGIPVVLNKIYEYFSEEIYMTAHDVLVYLNISYYAIGATFVVVVAGFIIHRKTRKWAAFRHFFAGRRNDEDRRT